MAKDFDEAEIMHRISNNGEFSEWVNFVKMYDSMGRDNVRFDFQFIPFEKLMNLLTLTPEENFEERYEVYKNSYKDALSSVKEFFDKDYFNACEAIDYLSYSLEKLKALLALVKGTELEAKIRDLIRRIEERIKFFEEIRRKMALSSLLNPFNNDDDNCMGR